LKEPHYELDRPLGKRKGYAEAEKSLLASQSNVTFTKCLGLPEAEFEDLLHEEVYAELFMTRFSVDVRNRPFDAKEKWSKRMRFGLTKAGKSSSSGEVWPEKDEYEDKRAIAELVKANPVAAIHPAREDVVKAFVTTLENKLSALSVCVKLRDPNSPCPSPIQKISLLSSPQHWATLTPASPRGRGAERGTGLFARLLCRGGMR
jgi:hypothetical protein